jgi:hypothetical protein
MGNEILAAQTNPPGTKSVRLEGNEILAAVS